MLQRTSASRSGILLTPISAPGNPWDGFSTFQRSVDDRLQDDSEYLSPDSAKMAFALVIFLRGAGVRILGRIGIVRDGKVWTNDRMGREKGVGKGVGGGKGV